ncbi:RNA polymerase-associated protein Rtf1-like [Drosophila obscura]|uniref:RNA polymerase-associated protein Rtf1-like n=1 Tax=Drosophila obscura TaxID=7282 RepID=UPI001BB25603|nr:RNA polymerase-associated protein Rtf1-like [Drosophila obscura]
MTLEQLEETQKIYLRRLEREDLEEGECPEQEDSAAQKERSLTRRQDLQILRAVNNRSTALQRLQVERLQKLAKKTNGGDQCLNDRIDQWLDDSCRDRGKLSKKDKRLQEVAKVRLRASDIYSDSSSDSSASSEADDNEDSQKCKPTTASPTLLSTLDELHDVVLTRSQLIDFVDKPIFEQTVIDCFVHMPSHKPQSKVYQIIGLLQSRKTYQLGNKTTDYMLRLRHAKLESTARLDAVCDSPVEPEAFENWIESCQQAYCTLPELSLLAKKQKDIEKATNYQFTEEDVAEIVKKKRESGQRKEKVAVLKIRLIEQRDLALTNNDQEEVARLESEIEEIDRDQEKSRYGYSRHQQGLRFGGSLRTGLTPYVPKIVLPKSQHRREAALVPAIPHRHKPARRGPVVVAARPIPAAAPPDTDADALTADEPYIPRFLKMADKAKASGRPAIAAVARLPKPLLAKRSFAESAPKPEDAELEHFMKRKYQKSAIGMRSREADDARLTKSQKLWRRTNQGRIPPATCSSCTIFKWT